MSLHPTLPLKLRFSFPCFHLLEHMSSSSSLSFTVQLLSLCMEPEVMGLGRTPGKQEPAFPGAQQAFPDQERQLNLVLMWSPCQCWCQQSSY